MVYALADTCVLIDLERIDLGDHQDSILVVSAVSVGELAFGADSGPDPEVRQKRLRDVLERFEILPYGVEEAKLYGVMATLVRASGRNPRPRRLDLQIAATASALRVPVLTRNPDDFRGMDRLVEVVAVN
ncbi:type II toxin-antitoxin system VapC family toxin [Pseudonocardia sp. MH-G8]|uniref:type II toxin-antitoxin system VapC family toxin n=1 Tax=Pseudonocardia sp. MH-G8 TaxID=1854588 RepID=UPI000BA130EE|nr:type II toxin-antitoxin system VapC family toxin [Pseudonocardia sp. MH-G8]OZM76302.1 VapC toxin family PIN domain ribonuclease [Pseudonocardia sp. MH-G8]